MASLDSVETAETAAAAIAAAVIASVTPEELPAVDVKRTCRCPLCGISIVASSQDECVDHMRECSAFKNVHPDTGPTNFDYFNQNKKDAVPSPVAAEEPVPTVATDAAITAMNIKELKRFIEVSGLRHEDCVEKADLVARAREALPPRA
jgi:hypothetical protein